MAKHTSRTKLPALDTNCMKCEEQCTIECLQCVKCEKHIHNSCSGLPDYSLITWFYSRTQFICEMCTQKNLGTKYDEVLAWSINIRTQDRNNKKISEKSSKNIQTENEIGTDRDTKNSTTHEKIDEIISEVTPNNEEGTEPVTTNKKNEHPVQNPKLTICHFYRIHKCKYGKLGSRCKFGHPPLCKFYKLFGCDPNKGCKNKDQCKFFHPQICRESENKRACYNDKCTRLHLKGTLRYKMLSQTRSPPLFPSPPSLTRMPSLAGRESRNTQARTHASHHNPFVRENINSSHTQPLSYSDVVQNSNNATVNETENFLLTKFQNMELRIENMIKMFKHNRAPPYWQTQSPPTSSEYHQNQY